MFTLKFLVHWCEGSYCAEAEPEVICDGAVRFCENDAGELLMYIELVL